ncbi:MAG: DUF3108 domain-containing protein [Prevotellaceae bacterium]|nr:DUF3108 domain-containing protein [Prevotella sp.]MCI7786692.1 DUF3108 domain-containing protein [Prevotella sp.]MDD5876202.1 DUF3108 domain-containing protein [Prevotellaceae bacterium]MDD7421522.1 DUF3108 domain-containing protein [Prevotellaceae bacterium]
MRLLSTIIIAIVALSAQAQCQFRNTAFKSGEFLTYNLYYNWKFVWVKAGTASMSTVQSQYRGQQAWRSSLTTRGNRRVDDLFVLRDTLLCYTSTKLEPLYFRKGAHEGKRYTVDEVFYTYHNGLPHLRQHRQHNDGTHAWKQSQQDQCIYDMMSIFLRARSFDPTGWKKGNTINFPIADGKNIDRARIYYRGKTTVKADNGHKYRCLQLSYMEKERDEAKYKEIVRFYVTDDTNHIPVRLDMFLKFGSAKAFLVSMKGTKGSVAATN